MSLEGGLEARVVVNAPPDQRACSRRWPAEAVSNSTRGTSWAPSAASKYSRAWKPNAPAKRFLGKVRMLALYWRTAWL